jgi:hypothetical protein
MGASKERTFTVRISVDHTLPVSALWPDGDAPENPTAADVEELIENDGGYERIISEWNLDLHGEVDDDQALHEAWKRRQAKKAAKP